MGLKSNACAALLVLSTAQAAAANCERAGGGAGPRTLDHPVKSQMTGRFGLRRNRITGFLNSHSGIDYSGQIGDPVMSAAAGEVVFAARQSGFGLVVMIDHGEIGVETVYAHLDRADVTVGACVSRGEIIGAVGQSGRAMEPHLHFEVRRAINPLSMMRPRGERGEPSTPTIPAPRAKP